MAVFPSLLAARTSFPARFDLRASIVVARLRCYIDVRRRSNTPDQSPSTRISRIRAASARNAASQPPTPRGSLPAIGWTWRVVTKSLRN